MGRKRHRPRSVGRRLRSRAGDVTVNDAATFREEARRQLSIPGIPLALARKLLKGIRRADELINSATGPRREL